MNYADQLKFLEAKENGENVVPFPSSFKPRRNRVVGFILSRAILLALLILLPTALVSGYFVLEKFPQISQTIKARIDLGKNVFGSAKKTFTPAAAADLGKKVLSSINAGLVPAAKVNTPNFPQKAAQVILARGNALRAKGQYKEAAHAYKTSLKKFAAQEDNRGRGNAHVEIAILHTRTGDYSTAGKQFQKALGYFVWADDSDGIGYANINLAQLYYIQKRYRSAEKYFLTGEHHYKKTDNMEGLGNAALGLGNLYTATHQTEFATRRFVQAEKLFQQAGNNRGLISTYNALDRAFRSMGTRYGNTESRRYYQLAKSIQLDTDSTTLPDEFTIRNSFTWLVSTFDQHKDIYQAELNTKARRETEQAFR